MPALNDLTDVAITDPQVGDRLRYRNGVWVNEAPTAWERNPYWLPMPNIEATDQEIAILMAVNDTDSNFVAFTISGAYTVDWGDGSAPQNFASGAKAEHLYDYADTDLTSVTDLPYKQALIRITPQSANDLTNVNFQVRHSGASEVVYNTQFLDVTISVPNATALTFGGATVRHSSVERVTLLTIGSVTNMGSMFNNCSSLQTVPLFDTSSVTNMSSMFNNCSSLQTVPLFDTSSVTNMGSMFKNCSALHTISALDMSAIASDADQANFVQGCSSLARLRATGIKWNLDVGSCNLSGAALNEIYGNLASVPKTITITGNYGAATDNPTIATAKGWTVVN